MCYIDTELIVRYAETDQMGIVHHSVYPVWFEAGRTEYIREMGISYSEIESHGLMLPLKSYWCEFFKPAKYEEKVIIRTKFKLCNGVRLTIAYDVINKETLDLIAKGESEHVWTDLNLRPVNVKKKNASIYTLVTANIEKI